MAQIRGPLGAASQPGFRGFKGFRGVGWRGFAPRVVAACRRRVVFASAQGATALRAEGCGIAPWAMNIKSALRDLLSVPYGMKSILVISRCAAPPYPAAPDFPPSGGQNKTPRNILFISISTVSTGCCAPSKRGKGGGVSHQRGNAFPRPSGRLYGFRCRQAAYKTPL